MTIGRFTVLSGLFASIAIAQVNTASPAQSPKGRVIWSKELGRLESRDSHAVVTALIVEDASEQSRWLRGVRIDFSWAEKHSTIYVDESLLQAEKKIYDDLTRDIGIPILRAAAGLGFVGSCEFRDHPGLYPLQADYEISGPDAPALRIFVPTRGPIMFPGIMPNQLSKVLGYAIDELKTH